MAPRAGAGASSDGTVLKLSSKGKFAVLCSVTGAYGANPGAGLIFDAKGNLYGTTSGGGSGAGVVFKVSKGKETVLCSFTGAADGGIPRQVDYGREGKPLWHHKPGRRFQRRRSVQVNPLIAIRGKEFSG